MIRKSLFIVCMLLLVSAVFISADDDGGFTFNLDLGLGVQTFNEGDEEVTYQTLSLMPDIGLGKFGLGLDLTLNYIMGSEDQFLIIRSADWVPGEELDFLPLYLPKLRYVRWGVKGDPLYVKLGSIDDATLGTGFIMGNYSNTLFVPEQRISA